MNRSVPFSLDTFWLLERAKISPDTPAIIEDNERITFQQLYERSVSRVRQLRRMGIKKGDIVASLLPSGLPAVEIFHAVHLCGVTLLPLNLRLTPAEIGFQLDETDARVLIVEESFISPAREVCKASDCPPLLITYSEDNRLVRLDAVKASPVSGEEEYPGVECSPEVPWAILYTSGTTGTPKGVPLTARHFGASAMASVSHLGTKDDDRWLACVPLFHIAGLSILTRSVLAGVTVVLHESFNAEKISRALDEQHITLMSLVPTMLHRLVDVRLAQNSSSELSLRAILIGGAPCSETLRQQSLDLGLPVLRTYGLTEACSQVATEMLLPDGRDTPPEAKPLQGIQVKIINSSGRSLNANEEGEILVRGEMVMDHYYRRPEESAKALQNGWLHTGDIGFLNTQGGLCVLNRRSDLIVTGGENVYPAEVEACLMLCPLVKEVCVTGEDDPEFGQRVVAWIIRKKTSLINEEELQQHCRKTLAGYKIPRRIIFLSQLPKNVSGKIVRQNLKSSLS